MQAHPAVDIRREMEAKIHLSMSAIRSRRRAQERCVISSSLFGKGEVEAFDISISIHSSKDNEVSLPYARPATNRKLIYSFIALLAIYWEYGCHAMQGKWDVGRWSEVV